MAALDFPDNPTNGQVFDKWTWNGTMWVLTASGSGGGGGSGFTFNQDAVPTATRIGDTWYETDTGDSFVWTNDGNSTQWVQFAPGSGGGGGSGFTYVTDTKPTPSKVGDTWFDTSTLASGGTSWLAIEESPGGEKVWVQFAPGAGGAGVVNPGLPAWQKATGSPSGIVSPTAVPGAQVDFIGVVGAVYRITVEATVFVAGAATQAALLIYKNSVQVQGAYSPSIPAGGFQTLIATFVESPGAIALAYGMALNRQSGTGSVGLSLDPVRPDFILVERMNLG